MTPAQLQDIVDMLNKLYNSMNDNGYKEAAEMIALTRDKTIEDYYKGKKR